MALSAPTDLANRITALGPWFHNLCLDGVYTAPDHFLGDYPQVKYRRFRDAIPADLRGKQVLDIGCNAGFYSLEMKKGGPTAFWALTPMTDIFARRALLPRCAVSRSNSYECRCGMWRR
jgi:hypothetical protein